MNVEPAATIGRVMAPALLLKHVRGEGRGFILAIALVFTSLLGVGSVLSVSGTLGAIVSAGKEIRDKRAFFQADGSAALCLKELRNRVLVAVPAQLATVANITTVTPYVPGDPAGFLIAYAYQSGSSFGGSFVRDSAIQARLELTYNPSGAPRPYSCILTIISRIPPANVNSGSGPPVYLFRYRYTIDGRYTNPDGSLAHQVNLQGTFSILVQNDNFARYALFTNRQTNAANTAVWFTNRTNFSGPVHTNGQFNFANNPGGNFTDVVESVNSMGNYYNSNNPVQLNADRNGDLDVPVFGAVFARGVANLPMPALTTADSQRAVALGSIPSVPSTNGVYLGQNGTAVTGGIYVKSSSSENLSIALSAPVTGVAQYTITRAGIASTVRVNYTTRQTTIQQGINPVSTYAGLPNGMLFVDGQVSSLAGTVQRDTELTIAAMNDIIITNNLMYENYIPGTTPSAEGTTNLLGILSWDGNVRISTAAPNDIAVHATVMSPNHEFTVDSYSSGASRGTATILGGVIENTYGAFGTFGTSTTGYGRNFVYDTRMRRGRSPPFFPTIGRVLSTVTGVNDRPNWRQTN